MFDAKTIRLAEALRPDLDFSVLGTEEFAILKIVENATGGGVVPIYDADISNGIASFSGVTKSKPLVSLKLNIPVTQTGSGTPSPDNKRDFIGFSGVNIGQTSDYGEYFRGLLNGTYGFVDLGSLTWSYGYGTEQVFYTMDITDMSKAIPFDNMACSGFEALANSVLFRDMTNYSIKRGNSDSNKGIIYVKDTDYTDADDFTTAVSGVYLIYKLAEPSTPVTPQDFATLCQAFGITGNTYQISFGQTVYSAFLDVLNGKLLVTTYTDVLRGGQAIAYGSTSEGYIHARIFLSSGAPLPYNPTSSNTSCNMAKWADSASSGGIPSDTGIRLITGNNSVYFYGQVPNVSTIDEFKTWLNSNKLYISYPIETPIEIDLTPTVINTLIGENVIFADVADVTECKYTRK